jgi:cbb3-type cytochrome c oxidase subunit III
MRWSSRILLFTSALTLPLGLAAYGSPQDGASADATTLKNPVPVNATTLAEGKQLFTKNCLSCHGPLGKGDGKAGAALKPPPADLTDEMWKHGSSDAEIFTVIRDGAKGTPMRGFAGRMTTKELWTVLNYVRTLGPAKGRT